MRLLLDTHALLWWWQGNARLSKAAQAAIAANDVWVSPASAWEIATKVRLGRLPQAQRLSDTFEAGLKEQGFRQLAITIPHAILAGRLPGEHGDPFDRMLAAQSLIDEIPVVTKDEAIRSFGVSTIW